MNKDFLEVLLEERKRKLSSITVPRYEGEIVINDKSSANVSEDQFSVTLAYVADRINIYRRIRNLPEVDFAISEIINEMVIDTEDDIPVKLSFLGSEVKDNLKKKMEEAFLELASRLNFKENLYEWAENWYIDGRLYLEKIRGNSGKVVQLRMIDSTKIIKVVKYNKDKSGKVTITDKFYWYSPVLYNQNRNVYGDMLMVYEEDDFFNGNTGRIIPENNIIFIHSGLVDRSSGFIYSHLHKAIRPANMLSLMEDSTIVYRITRAPEKRAFYVDTGHMSPERSLEHLNQLKNQYKTEIRYDPETGTVKDNKHIENIQNDYWLARRFGQRATEITTIAGPSNSSIGDSEEIKYFQEKLYKALNIPPSRFMEEGVSVVLGMQNEISREERKFSKFIYKLRRRFSEIFYDVLRIECIKEGIIDKDDWIEIKPYLFFEWTNDSYYEEAKTHEVMSNRLDMAEKLRDYGGFPEKWIQRNVLKLTEKEIEELEKMKAEEEEKEKESSDDDMEDDEY